MKDLYRVAIAGSYGNYNLGDEAILQGILAELRAAVPVEVTVFSRVADDTRVRHRVERVIPVRQLTRGEVKPEVQRLDLLILGGGGLLFDAEVRTFLREVLERTGCGLLLDVNNVHVSCTNHGHDALDRAGGPRGQAGVRATFLPAAGRRRSGR